MTDDTLEDWHAYPVIHIDFSGIGYKSSSLPEAISGIMECEAAVTGSNEPSEPMTKNSANWWSGFPKKVRWWF